MSQPTSVTHESKPALSYLFVDDAQGFFHLICAGVIAVHNLQDDPRFNAGKDGLIIAQPKFGGSTRVKRNRVSFTG